MSATNEIHSITDLVKILAELGEAQQGHTRFFRGHSKTSYLMQPSIYRQSHLIENEDKIIRDAFTNCSDDFLPHHTLFQKLVKLQHYGYATRLLDLTINALVALYFAASSSDNEEGELIILDIPNNEIKYDDSDTVAILSAISLSSKDDCMEIKSAISFADGEAKERVQIYLDNSEEKINTEEKLKRRGLSQEAIAKSIDNEANYLEKKTYSETFCAHDNIKNLLHNIRTDKPSFEAKINPDDIKKVLCVRAKLNNARISRQQGLFLLFGIDDTKVKPANVPDEWLRKVDNQKIIIKNKQQIMKELKSFGISKQTLFPELESQAQEIMAQYKPK